MAEVRCPRYLGGRVKLVCDGTATSFVKGDSVQKTGPNLDVPGDYHEAVLSRYAASECVLEILSIIRSSHAWLYPTAAQGKPETELNTAVLKNVISDNLLAMEITATQMIWPGHLLQKSPQMIDEYLGTPYECAYESFCPNPCCHGVPTSSEAFLSRKCALNKCVHRDRCLIEPEFNDDFVAIRRNRWNITCPCGRGLMYRADVETCVHADLCSDESRCPDTFDCVNTVTDPGFRCVCQLGYVKDETGKCQPISMSTADWHGFAFSEPHPKMSSRMTFTLLLLLLLPAI
ncbi:unnamed protein product [Heligmosomoides polygyrus]|uniref:EGF-like domain-containing protein n=1 Tax=Heligmosomoides polygyrus TaxID=6339 RepID=A0A3P7ZBU1_HELPZ|nr:unnamed protein product [Heligmosomoides polygyrus]